MFKCPYKSFMDFVDEKGCTSERMVLRTFDSAKFQADITNIGKVYNDFLRIETKKLSDEYPDISTYNLHDLDTLFERYIEPSNKFEYKILKDLDSFIKNLHDPNCDDNFYEQIINFLFKNLYPHEEIKLYKGFEIEQLNYLLKFYTNEIS